MLASCKNESQNLQTKPDSDAGGKKGIFHPRQEKRSKCDSINKISDVFVMNNIACFWQFTAKTYNGDDGDGKLILINQRTNKILLEDHDYYQDVCHAIDFKAVNSNNFKDVNFDGCKDFVVFTRTGSGSGGEVYNIYLFDKKTSGYRKSELSGAYPTIDSINRTLKTSWRSGAYSYSENTTYFDQKGKVKYTMIYEEDPVSEDVIVRKSKKKVKSEIVQIQIDTIKKNE